MYSPVLTHFAAFPAHAVVIAAMHPPVATDLTVVVSGSITLSALIPLSRKFWSGWGGTVCGAAIVDFPGSWANEGQRLDEASR